MKLKNILNNQISQDFLIFKKLKQKYVSISVVGFLFFFNIKGFLCK